MIETLGRVAKALTAALSAASAAAVAACLDGAVTAGEWVTIVVAGVGAGLATYGVRNGPAASSVDRG
jgi:hypothetical protein